jgi:hypothetical protein
VQKTPTRPQWIWSSFEHVDNVPPANADNPGFLTLNDRTATAMPAQNPYPVDPPITPTPAPFNVQRIKPIHSSTAATSAAYRQALKNAGSVWQFYQLVMTQWPLQPNSPGTPGTPPNTFPGSSAGADTTAFAKSISTGCMACHNVTKARTDFLWSLNDHAFPANVPSLLLHDSSLRQLKTLLRTELNGTSPVRTASPQDGGMAATPVPVLNTFRDVQNFIQAVLQRNGEAGGVQLLAARRFLGHAFLRRIRQRKRTGRDRPQYREGHSPIGPPPPNSVRLIGVSPGFYRYVMNYPIPTDPEAARALSGSPAALDLLQPGAA